MVATGLIVGESLFGVLNAGIIAAAGDGDALAVFPESWSTAANWLGPIVFVLAVAGCYRFVQGLGRKS